LTALAVARTRLVSKVLAKDPDQLRIRGSDVRVCLLRELLPQLAWNPKCLHVIALFHHVVLSGHIDA
jgi:hypothetical protein